MSVTKGSEFTYGVHARSLRGLIKDNEATIMHPGRAQQCLEDMDGMIMGSVRKLNDQFELLRQGIAYTLVFKVDHKGEVLFLVYKRTKRNGEGRLAEKLSLAPGGHIEGCDLAYYKQPIGDGKYMKSDTIDWSKTMTKNLGRELREEVQFKSPPFERLGRDLGIMIPETAKPIGFVMDSRVEIGYVGNTHFGAIFVTSAPSDASFSMKEECNTSIGWVGAQALTSHLYTRDALASGENGKTKFEPWSEMIIAKIDEVVRVIREAFNVDDVVKPIVFV